ncbi:MAG: hypothetical protein EYC70_03500 [Planctomycetota bacterium]|nr:MAG: hypothetical protein EYC70_03500 [Planctomycetota bacterium]
MSCWLAACALAVALAARNAPAQDGPEPGIAAHVAAWLRARAEPDQGAGAAALGAIEAGLAAAPLSAVDVWSRILDLSRVQDAPWPVGVVHTARSMGLSYWVRLPEPYEPRAHPVPMILILAEPGPQPPAEMVEGLPEAVRDQAVLVALDLAPLPIGAWRDQWAAIGTPLAELFASLRVDRDRVAVVGSGVGADLAVLLAALHPEWFHALGLVGGAAAPEEPGARALPVRALHPDLPQAALWCLQQPPRDPDPRAFDLTLADPRMGRAFWVHVVEFDYAGVSSPGTTAQLQVAADRASNTVRIDGVGVDQVDLYLNDRLVDLDRPIHIVRNGFNYDFHAARSLRIVLELFYRHRDPGSVYPVIVRGLYLPRRD